MATLKDLIVQGPSRFIGNIIGSKFITDGGTATQFVKGDGTLDSTSYAPYSALNEKQDTLVSGTSIKTINGEALLGSGNIQLQSQIPKVNHGTSDTTFSLTPNNQHIWGSVSSLTLTLTPPNDTSVVNEYLFIFTSPATPTTLSLPATIDWAISLDIEPNKTYQVSIVDNLATYLTAEMVIAGGDAGTPAWATKEYVDAKLDGIESLLSEL